MFSLSSSGKNQIRIQRYQTSVSHSFGQRLQVSPHIIILVVNSCHIQVIPEAGFIIVAPASNNIEIASAVSGSCGKNQRLSKVGCQPFPMTSSVVMKDKTFCPFKTSIISSTNNCPFNNRLKLNYSIKRANLFTYQRVGLQRGCVEAQVS